MGRSKETYNKKEVRNKKEKKRKEKEKKKLARKEGEKANSDDMIAYVDENGMITSTPPDPTKKKDIKLVYEIHSSVPDWLIGDDYRLLQILNNHAPIISTLDPGNVRVIDENDRTSFFTIGGGVVEVKNNHIMILAESE